MNSDRGRHREAWQALDAARERDALGHRVHTWLAMIHLFSLPLTTAGKDWTFGLLIFYALLRLPHTWRCYRARWISPAVWALLAWAIIVAISIIWSDDALEGVEELKAYRVILLPLALWPVLDRVVWLIGALLAGVFVMNVVQLLQFLDVLGLELQGDDRARAWLHPIQTGMFALAALLWAMMGLMQARISDQSRARKGAVSRSERTEPESASVRARLRYLRDIRTFLVIAAGAAAFGLIASGSRGVWLAVPIVVVGLLLVGLARGETRRAAMALIAAGAIAAGVLALVRGEYISHRITSAIEEIRSATDPVAGAEDEEMYDSSLGKRVLYLRWGWRSFRESPIIGIGAGAFREYAKETREHEMLAERWPGRAERNRFAPAHPHSVALHALSATGILGFAAFAITIVLVLIACARERRDHLFAGAAIFILIGWLIGGQSDCYNLNGHLFGLFAFIIAVAHPLRPPPEGTIPARRDTQIDTDREWNYRNTKKPA